MKKGNKMVMIDFVVDVNGKVKKSYILLHLTKIFKLSAKFRVGAEAALRYGTSSGFGFTKMMQLFAAQVPQHWF
jgi:hypothetical protein